MVGQTDIDRSYFRAFSIKSFAATMVDLRNDELSTHTYAARVWCKDALPKVELFA